MLFNEESEKRLSAGGLLALVVAILIAIFLWLLSPFSFICTDPEICNRPGTIRLPPQP